MNSSLERTRKLRIGGTYAFFIIGSIVMIFPFEKFRLRPKLQAKAADVSECPQEMRSMLALTSSATLCITVAASSLLVKMEIAAALSGSQTALSSLMAG